MNEVAIFSNPEFGQVRTTTIDGEPWFIGKDVADALGYTNSRKALIDHVDDEDKGVTNCDTLGGTQEMTIINESGLYALIFGSRLTSAIRFKRWVTSEVLPSIRKTGSYNAVTEQIPYDKYLEAAKVVRGCKNREERNLIIGILQNGGFNIPVIDVVSVDVNKVNKVEFSEEFKKFLKDNGYSYRTFSEVSGLAKSCIHNYATGKTVADEKNMKVLEEYGFRKTEVVVEELQTIQRDGETKMAKKEMSTWEKEVRKALIDKDMNIPDLAAVVGFNVTYLYDVFSGARKGKKVKAAINKYLGIEGE